MATITTQLQAMSQPPKIHHNRRNHLKQFDSSFFSLCLVGLSRSYLLLSKLALCTSQSHSTRKILDLHLFAKQKFYSQESVEQFWFDEIVKHDRNFLRKEKRDSKTEKEQLISQPREEKFTLKLKNSGDQRIVSWRPHFTFDPVSELVIIFGSCVPSVSDHLLPLRHSDDSVSYVTRDLSHSGQRRKKSIFLLLFVGESVGEGES